MKGKKQWIACLAVIFWIGSYLPAWAAAPPDITADAAIVVDENTGEVLYEKNPDKREYPASMTKIMTCLLAVENGNLQRIVEVSDRAADVECTRLRPGYRARMSTLLLQMMMISDNGCATAVGESLSAGDVQDFARLMNRRAKELGAVNTHFVNANGMPDPNHYSTARDMADIACYAMHNKIFRHIVGTEHATVSYLSPAGHTEYCVNTDDLLRDYPGCTGGKTGWTRSARGCLMAAAARNGRELLTVVMHSQDEETRFSEAEALLDYGFQQ